MSRAPGAATWALVPVVIIVALAWVGLSWPWLSGQMTIPWDAKAHFQPQLQFLANAFARGESPFWNPYVFAGSPQIADPQSLIFSPPHWLLAWLDPTPSLRAADMVSFGMLGLGALAMVLFTRDRGWHPAGAVVAALAFAFGASAAWRIQHTGQIMSLAWWAIAFLCLDRALRRGSWGWGLASGITAGCMVLGRDQVAWLGVWFFTYWVIWFVATQEKPLAAALDALRPLTAGFIGGTLTAGLPLLMTILLADDSNRADIVYSEAVKGSFHPAGFLTLFVANLFGADGPFELFWGPPAPEWGKTDLYLARNMLVLYLGAVPLVALLSVGVARKAFAEREIRGLVVGAVLLILYALGRYTPAYALLYHLPGGHLFRRPADATFLIGAVLALLAGYGVHRLASEPERFDPRRNPWILALPALGWLAGVATAAIMGRLAQAAPTLLTSLAILASGSLACVVIAGRGRQRPLAMAAGLAALMVVDLNWSNGPSESTALPPATYDVLRPDTANATIAFLKDRVARDNRDDRRDRIELAGVDFHWPNITMIHRLDHTLGYNPVRLEAYTAATGAQDHVAVPAQRSFAPLFPTYRSLMADMLGLRWIVTRYPIEQQDPAVRSGDFPLAARTTDGYIYENPRALPRVLFATQAQKADFAQLTETGMWPEGFDPRRTVLLEDAPEQAAPPRPAGRARILRYANTEVVVETQSPSAGWLVLNDVFHPWWDVMVDGKPAAMLRANVLFRAVPVESGTHRVTFRFQPIPGLFTELQDKIIDEIETQPEPEPEAKPADKDAKPQAGTPQAGSPQAVAPQAGADGRSNATPEPGPIGAPADSEQDASTDVRLTGPAITPARKAAR